MKLFLTILIAFMLSTPAYASGAYERDDDDDGPKVTYEKPDEKPDEPEKPVIERGPGSGTARGDRRRTVPNYCRCYEAMMVARKPASCLWTNDANKLEARRGTCSSRRRHD